jgi:hypothetical protein
MQGNDPTVEDLPRLFRGDEPEAAGLASRTRLAALCHQYMTKSQASGSSR